MVSAKKSRFKRISVIIITSIFIFITLSLTATKLIYDGIFARYDTAAPIDAALSQMVQKRQLCQFPSGENQLTGYYYEAAAPNRTNGLVVLVPGFHAGADDYLWQIRELTDYGWGVFTFDITGTLRSQGKNQVGFSQPLLDLEAALKYVEKNHRFGYTELVLMGHSQGAYAACCALAGQHDISAVVSVSGVNSAMESIMHMSTQTVGPVAYGNYGFLWLYQAMLFGPDVLELEAAKAISESDVPVLVIHGQQDTQIPPDRCSIYSHKDKITSSHVAYLLCHAGHTDILYDTDGTANDDLMRSIHEFLTDNVH